MCIKRLFPIIAVLFAAVFFACSDDSDKESPVSFDQLPEQAQSFVKLFFSDSAVQSVETSGSGWNVNFTNGTEIDFNSEGSWTSIDCGLGVTVPYDLVPEGQGAEDNVVVKTGGHDTVLPQNALPHWELAKKYNLIDFDLGLYRSGSSAATCAD